MNPALFAVAPLDDGVVSLRVATDDEPYLGSAWVEGFSRVLAGLGEDRTVRAVVLEGGGRYFSAGASREALLQGGGEGVASYASRAPHALLALPVPAIASVAGHALGGGLLLALWCDVAVLADESLYGANFMALGFTPGMGATFALEEAFGAPLGRDLLFTGRLLTGREIRANACPLSHAVRPRAEVRDRAVALAREMAEAPRAALALLKETLAARRREGMTRALAAERVNHARLFADAATAREIARRYAGEPDRSETS